jgi:hypothetical protein
MILEAELANVPDMGTAKETRREGSDADGDSVRVDHIALS